MKYFAFTAHIGTSIGQEAPQCRRQHAGSTQALYRLLWQMQGNDHGLGPGPIPTPSAAVSACDKLGFSLLPGGGPGHAAPPRHVENTSSHPTAQAAEKVNLQLHSVPEVAERQNWDERETQTQIFLPFFKFLPSCQGINASSSGEETPD